MRQPYAGRHRPAPAPSTLAPRSARHAAAKAVRRPVLSTGAAIALLGASAAGYAKAGTTTGSAASFTIPASAVSQANDRNAEHAEQSSYREVATTALGARQSAAADAEKAQQQAEAQRIADERQASDQRAAREAQRAEIVANAQQDPRSVARLMLGDYGWSDSQWSCLEKLWVGESGWNYKATNSSSGAFGIPQSLPASKMATVAGDYRTNPVTQITWGMNYIKASYGSPCNAWSLWNNRSPHWY